MSKLLVVLSYCLFLSSAPAQEHKIEGPLQAEDGETCVVCYGRCSREDVAFLVDGQRFAVMKPLQQDFLADPNPYIRAYKPNSMQFDANAQQGMSDSFILFGLLALVGVFCAGYFAHHLVIKRSNPAAIPAGLGKIPTTKLPQPCTACGGENHPAAKRCSHCGASFTPGERSEVDQA